MFSLVVHIIPERQKAKARKIVGDSESQELPPPLKQQRREEGQLGPELSPLKQQRREEGQLGSELSPLKGWGREEGQLGPELSPLKGWGREEGQLGSELSPLKGRGREEGQPVSAANLEKSDIPSSSSHFPTFQSAVNIEKLFTKELEEARQRLAKDSSPSPQHIVSTSTSSSSHTITPSISPTTHTPPLTDHRLPTHTRPSHGHRAGFDAFMTGHAFAYYALALNLTQCGQNEQHTVREKTMIAGLSSMRNHLNNSGRPLPLLLTRSQFSRTSQAHKDNQSIIKQCKRHLFNT